MDVNRGLLVQFSILKTWGSGGGLLEEMTKINKARQNR